MQRQDFAYELPDELIAREPAVERTGSRLLCLDGVTGELQHSRFACLTDHLKSGDVMVFNDTKVIPARLFGHKSSGGRVEILVERVLDETRFLAHVKASKSPKAGAEITLEDGSTVTMVARHDALFEIDCGPQTVIPLLESIGHMPLPPYINRDDVPEDQSRYQTVYGRHAGAVAAPTAGLHFDDALLELIRKKGIEIVYATLHVGAGTFQPVRVDDIKEHHMHSEWMTIDQSTCDVINRARQENRRVVAVGTTSVRCLETAAKNQSDGKLLPFEGETDIFIYPSYEFKQVDALITNFHLSESTLLMLVSAFAGYQHIMKAYREAVDQRYRFFSYGDAMWLTRNPLATSEKIERN